MGGCPVKTGYSVALAETETIICFQPVKRGGLVRIQPEPMTVLNKAGAFLRIFHRAAGFLIIRPVLDFRWRLRRAVVQQPDADVVIIFRDLDGGFELVGR